MYKVDFYTLPSGRSPIHDFVKNSEVRVQRKILRQVKHLTEYGLTLENRYLRKLTGTVLWESRILGKDNIRIICVQIKQKITVLNIFKKKKTKTPSREIEISKERYKDLTKYI